MYSIEYYEEDGKFPVVDFFRTLNTKESAKILREIDLLEKLRKGI